MEDFGFLWSYQESIDELREKLLYTTLELESVKTEASEEIRRHKEHVKYLVQSLKTACQERDEAKEQLQKLTSDDATQAEIFSSLPQLQSESQPVKPRRANSSITESNSLSAETQSLQSHGSSPVDSLESVSSPELPKLNMGDYNNNNNVVFLNQPLVQDITPSVAASFVPSTTVPDIDEASLVIDSLLKGKSLPQKGKLLQTVQEAGPLLETLLVAGPLPRWRNPPPLQPFQIPPVSIRGCDPEIATLKQPPSVNLNPAVAPGLFNPQSYLEMSSGACQMLASSMLNFGSEHCGTSLGNGRLISAGACGMSSSTSYIGAAGKRHRIL